MEHGYQSAVVNTPDSHISFIFLYHAYTIALDIYLDVGAGKHRKINNVSEITESKGEDYCATILGLYVFTGEDITSAFKGKVGPLKKFHKIPKYNAVFRSIIVLQL